MSLPLCCEVSELAPLAVLPPVIMWTVLTASSTCQGTPKRNGISPGWVLKGAACVWAPSSEHCSAPQGLHSLTQHELHSKGRGKHRIHEHRLAKVIILHYLLRGPELSGTPLTVCCAPHTAPLHSALPWFACSLEMGQIHQSARSTGQGIAFVISSANDFEEKIYNSFLICQGPEGRPKNRCKS